MSSQVMDVEKIVNHLETEVGDPLSNLMYTVVLNLHHFSIRDQERILVNIQDNISKLDINIQLWIARYLKDSFFALNGNALRLYFRILYKIESNSASSNPDPIFLAELIEQFGRLFKVYPLEEKRTIVKIFDKYVLNETNKFLLASCESIGIVAHDLDSTDREMLISSLEKTKTRNLAQDIRHILDYTISRLNGTGNH